MTTKLISVVNQKQFTKSFWKFWKKSIGILIDMSFNWSLLNNTKIENTMVANQIWLYEIVTIYWWINKTNYIIFIKDHVILTLLSII